MKKIFVFVSLSAVLFSSCIVSQKKYDALNLQKSKSDGKVDSLQKRISKLVKDYNQMRNEIASNNAEKDKLINEISKKVYGLSTNKDEIKDKLESIKDRHKWTQQENRQKDITISDLNAKIARIQAAYDDNKNSLSKAITQNKETAKKLKEKIKLLEKRNKLYQTQLKKLKDYIKRQNINKEE